MITQEELKSLLHYDKDTGVFTIKRFFGGKKTVGDIAGTTMADGYRKITINKIEYRAHRLAFLYMNGFIPELIDHKNQIRDDNRWDNLRQITRTGNAQNTKIISKNTSGCMGVSFFKLRNKWRSYITIDGVQKSLGLYTNKEDAIFARKKAEKEYGFYENHNKV